MQKQTKFKYGFQNANSYLHKLRRDKYNDHNISRQLANEKSKMLQSYEMPSSKQSPQEAQKAKLRKSKIRHQLDSNADLNKNNNKGSFIKKNGTQKLKIDSSFFERVTIMQQQLQKEKKKQLKIGLSDLIIKKHLANIRKIYKQDLDQLEQNRENLRQAIQELAPKIKGLADLQNKNQILELENFKSKKQLIKLNKQYQQMKLNLELKKIKAQQRFNTKRDKIKKIMELLNPQYEYVTQIQSWKQYFYELQINIKQHKQNPSEKEVLNEIFPRVQEVVSENNLKKKQKQKNKVVDKTGLLGDLKSFAKNFKMPSNKDSSQRQ